MRFGPVRYLDWARSHQGAPHVRFDLSASGMPERDLAAFLEPGALARRPNPLGALADLYGMKRESFAAVGGASAAIFVAVATLVEAGDAVVVEAPAYEPLNLVPEAFGARVVRAPRPRDLGWQIDWDRLESIVASERPKLLAFTHLHNPSGAVLADADLARLVAIAERAGAYLLLNTVYSDYCDGPARCFTALSPRVVVASSLTKVYGLGRIRYGWVASADDAVATAMRRMHDHIMVGHALPSEAIAERAIGVAGALRAEARERAAEGMPLLAEWVARTEGASWVAPPAGVFAFPRLPAGIDTLALARILEEEHATLVSAGEHFGVPGHLRIGVARGEAVVRDGLARLSLALDRLRSESTSTPRAAATLAR